MSVDRFSGLHGQVVNAFGDECLDERAKDSLGDAYNLAQQFREDALLQCEELLEWAERYLERLVSRRAKLAEGLPGGRTWEDLEESQEELNELADLCSDDLNERIEDLVARLEDRQSRLEEQEPNMAPKERLKLAQWIEGCLEKITSFSEELLERFDKRAAEILGT